MVKGFVLLFSYIEIFRRVLLDKNRVLFCFACVNDI